MKKKEEPIQKPVQNPIIHTTVVKSDKEILEDLYKQLKDLGINSIGDIEVRISKL